MTKPTKAITITLADGTTTTVERMTDADLDSHPITLPSGRQLDEAGAAELGRQVADRAAQRRGRPSLSGLGRHSPQIGVRLPPDLDARLRARAEREHKRPSDVVREALEHYV